MTMRKSDKTSQTDSSTPPPAATGDKSIVEMADMLRAVFATLHAEQTHALPQTSTTLSAKALEAIKQYEEIRQALATTKESLSDAQKAVQWSAAVALILEQLGSFNAVSKSKQGA